MLLDASVNEVAREVRNNFFHSASSVIVSMETAAVLLGMSPSSAFPITFLYSPFTRYAHSELFDGVRVRQLDRSEIIQIHGFSCANHERAICDMIKYDRDPQVIVEAMSSYYFSVGDKRSWGRLEFMARRYGIRRQFESFIADALDQAMY